MASTTLRASQRPGRCWTPPMDGSKSKLHNKRGQSAAILRWGIAPLPPHFSIRIGCIQSAIDSQAFAPTALDCLLDRPSPARLMRRDPTASYSRRARQIATSKRFELTLLRFAGSCECSLPSDHFSTLTVSCGPPTAFPDSTVAHRLVTAPLRA